MIEVLKQALEALQKAGGTCFDEFSHREMMSQPDHFMNQSITSLRQAIAELEQRTWVGLTEDDKVLIKHDANFNQFMTAGEYADRVQQLTEARLKDKNNG